METAPTAFELLAHDRQTYLRSGRFANHTNKMSKP